MGQYIQILLLVVTATMLLWFGYTLFFNIASHILPWNSGNFSGIRGRSGRGKRPKEPGFPGDPRICPVCSARLDGGELVKSQAFPSLNGGKDRLMYIKGCLYCLKGERIRACPVCDHVLNDEEVLVCRMFERRHTLLKRPHVHVLGCSRCKSGSVKKN